MAEERIVKLGKKSYDLNKLSDEQVIKLYEYVNKRTDQILRKLNKNKKEYDELQK